MKEKALQELSGCCFFGDEMIFLDPASRLRDDVVCMTLGFGDLLSM